jgi:hypothetical protein
LRAPIFLVFGGFIFYAHKFASVKKKQYLCGMKGLKGYKYNYREVSRLMCDMVLAYKRGMTFGKFCVLYKIEDYREVRMLMSMWNESALRSLDGKVYRRGGVIYVGEPSDHEHSVAVLRTDKQRVWAV